ncbi:Mitochondrial GTPase [Agyrium rufum]|nr:Mitochondrial GTPase [Agyrium rufum]
MATFTARSTFPYLHSLPRSYFLGHHRAGLNKMKTMLSSLDLIVECRDYRIPITSRNPLFEESLAGKERVIVYTKKDLGSKGTFEDEKRENLIREWHHPSQVLFSDFKSQRDVRRVLNIISEPASSSNHLLGSRRMIVGMPNVGKSTLLNALRHVGIQKGKVARTGAQPGVTRKIGTTVKIKEGVEGSEGVYLVDTPGVFMPYVPNAERMLKLALCGLVKDTIITPITLADYLLYHLNLHNPKTYSVYSEPTNEIKTLLENVGRQSGRLEKGGVPDLTASALWLIQRWRGGYLGKMILDDIENDSPEQHQSECEDAFGSSLHQARRSEKEARRQRSLQRQLNTG